MPVIDPTRCEAKGPCVPICPYDVLAIRPGLGKATECSLLRVTCDVLKTTPVCRLRDRLEQWSKALSEENCAFKNLGVAAQAV